MALANSDLFLVQDGTTSTNYKITFQNLTTELNSDYVNVSGDTMSGDLTMGSGDIVLSASTGQGSFSSISVSSDIIKLNADGSIEGELIDCGTY